LFPNVLIKNSEVAVAVAVYIINKIAVTINIYGP
jgi:hypothetical protein